MVVHGRSAYARCVRAEERGTGRDTATTKYGIRIRDDDISRSDSENTAAVTTPPIAVKPAAPLFLARRYERTASVCLSRGDTTYVYWDGYWGRVGNGGASVT